MMSQKTIVSTQIREARKKAGLKIKELAERLGTTPGTISQYERGLRTPNYYRLQRIAEALGTDVETLMAGTHQQWISVSERLPKDRKHVLIYSPDGGSAEGCYNESTKTWKQYRWRAEGLFVTHWMPLPEPPKEDDYEKALWKL